MKLSNPTNQSFQLSLFVAVSVVVGLFAVFYGFVFEWNEEVPAHILNTHPNALFVITPILLLASSALCRYFAPEAAGGGIDKIRESIEILSKDEPIDREGVRKRLGSRTIFVKFVSSILMVVGGGALGREGPVVQMAAGIFSMVGRKFRRVLPDIDLRAWIIAGSAAGFAAAFNTPLGGLVFALEELTELHISRIRAPLFLAVATAGLTALAVSGPYLLFATKTVVWKSSVWSILSAVLIGVIAGTIVVVFQKLSKHMHRALAKASPKSFWITPVVCGLLIALIARFFGAEVIGGGISSAQLAVTRPIAETSPLLFPAHVLTTLLTLVSGAAGGMLAPGLSLGAQMGVTLASIFGTLVDPTLLILASMAAFLAALVNAPFTATVLAMEMTNQHDLIFPLLITSLVSLQTANYFRSWDKKAQP